MTSTNTLYARRRIEDSDIDQTLGYFVEGDEIQGPLGKDRLEKHQLHGITPKTWIENRLGAHEVGFADLDAGVYHPRFHKGNWAMLQDDGFKRKFSRSEANEYATTIEQAQLTTIDLEEICRTVAPSPATKNAYGSKIRNLLIIACTEVESQLKGILKANQYQQPGRFTTNDYVKLLGPLRLSEYSLRLVRHRDYGDFNPFGGWDAASPTQSLPWYAAYNATKHDRELDFDKATLEHAISATGALRVLMLAQYGSMHLRPFQSTFFGSVKKPYWHQKERTYPPPTGAAWTPVPYTF
jgi:hypothetical protein